MVTNLGEGNLWKFIPVLEQVRDGLHQAILAEDVHHGQNQVTELVKNDSVLTEKGNYLDRDKSHYIVGKISFDKCLRFLNIYIYIYI